SAYVAAYRPTASAWVPVAVQREVDGRRSVVSHHAKHTRGLLVRHLVENDLQPQTPEDLADAAAGMIGGAIRDVELDAGRLTLVTRAQGG
ncbi:MAG: peroxide stress protein YaaA, partial [Actinomycetes bacterium]